MSYGIGDYETDYGQEFRPSDFDHESYPVGRAWTARQLNRLRAAKHRLPNTWITAEGEIIEMARMNNSHLRNTIQMLRRTALLKLSRLAVGDETLIPDYDMLDPDQKASAAWGAVYDELLNEAMCRSDGHTLEEWLTL